MIGLPAVILAIAGLTWFGLQARDGGGEPSREVAATLPADGVVVLPFENLGPPEDEYFAAGMTEEITSRLAR